LSSNVFSTRRRPRQYLTPEQRSKLIRDYVRARDAYRHALEEERRDREELIRLGLIDADENQKR
jgi:Spy/CpxP family protein refolding chaperone